MHIRLPEGMKVKSVASTSSATGASKAKVLANGQGIRWEGTVTELKFKATIK
jgi:hypothetical protein